LEGGPGPTLQDRRTWALYLVDGVWRVGPWPRSRLKARATMFAVVGRNAWLARRRARNANNKKFSLQARKLVLTAPHRALFCAPSGGGTSPATLHNADSAKG